MIPTTSVDDKVYIESSFVANAFRKALQAERTACVKLVFANNGDVTKTINEILSRTLQDWEDEQETSQ